MAPSSIFSWQLEGGKVEAVTDFIFFSSKITADGDCSKEIERCLLFEKKAMTKKQRYHFVEKGPYSQRYDFSSSNAWTWDLDYTEGWVPKNWCFWTRVLDKTLESPLDNKKIKPINLKGKQPWIFIGRTDAEAELQYSGHLMQRADSLEKTLMLGKTEDKRRWGQQRMRCLDNIINSTDMSLT